LFPELLLASIRAEGGLGGGLEGGPAGQAGVGGVEDVAEEAVPFEAGALEVASAE
jgi:hypothetical protein